MKHKTRTFFPRRPAAVLVIVALCFTLSATALASTGMHGFFQDITNAWGAVIGTSYENASDEIALDIAVDGNTLTALVRFTHPETPPFEAETLGIAAYQIVDSEGTVIQKGSSGSSPLIHGQAEIVIPLHDMQHGSCKLVVTSFVAEKKADQPMSVTGTWGSSFTR